MAMPANAAAKIAENTVGVLKCADETAGAVALNSWR
jgi:hypothetical protein